jgi:hypothetical protein
MIEVDPPRQFGQSKKRGAKGREQASLSEPAPLNLTTYFLTAISFPATNHLHRRITVAEIQKNATDSMTLATRRGAIGRWAAAAADCFAALAMTAVAELVRHTVHNVRFDSGRAPVLTDEP